MTDNVIQFPRPYRPHAVADGRDDWTETALRASAAKHIRRNLIAEPQRPCVDSPSDTEPA